MKKFTLLMVAGLFALAGSVQAQKKVILTADDVMINKGEEATLTVNMNYETSETLVGWGFSLLLPDGIKIKKVEDEDYEPTKKQIEEFGEDITQHPGYWKYFFNGKGTDFVNVNKIANSIQCQEKKDGGYLFIGIDQQSQSPMRVGDNGVYNGKVIEITLIADADVVGEGKIYSISITNDKSESVELGNIDDYIFGINQSGEQGINDIQAADATAPAYNLQGVRVNNNAKGVIIREGKKMIVK